MGTVIVSTSNSNKIEISNGEILSHLLGDITLYGTNSEGYSPVIATEVIKRKCALIYDPDVGGVLMLFGFFSESCTISSPNRTYDADKSYDGVYTYDEYDITFWDYGSYVCPVPINVRTESQPRKGVSINWNGSDTLYNPYNLPIFNVRTQLSEITAYFTTDTPITSNGGGATHIAKVTGQLSSLSNNLSDILMVSGGGGGGLIIGENTYAGKDAGGISGSGNNSADQSTGYAFGQGESDDGVSGGGGGLYGGYKGGTS